MKISFAGQTALVTGATRGIGKALALALALEEATVIVTGTGEFPPEWIERSDGLSLQYARLDLGSKMWRGQLAEITRLYQRIDVCINNAGINKISMIHEIDAVDLKEILDVNLYAPILISSELSRLMMRQQYGRIVNIASIFSVVTKPMRNAYTASKAGLVGVTKTMAVDLGGQGILVNAVSPGFVDTELTRRVLGKEKMAEIAGNVPLKRLAQVEDIVPAVLFLASKNNTYVTGQNLVVDGGFTLE